jgi:hypothetical protein
MDHIGRHVRRYFDFDESRYLIPSVNEGPEVRVPRRIPGPFLPPILSPMQAWDFKLEVPCREDDPIESQ